MDHSLQRNWKVSSEPHYPRPQNANQESSCAACRDCRSLHGLQSVGQKCILGKGCYVCADLARINVLISNLVKERQQIMMEKPRHDTEIHRMPVEILSMIFIFVKHSIFDYKFKEQPEHILPELPGGQPKQSPPLLVGAVCKKWRDITLSTPQLWTDIVINPWKCPDGQFDMVQSWARRSASLPLDIKIHFTRTGEDIPYGFEDVILAVRSLAVRWHDITFTPHCIPVSFFCKLLHDLPESPPLNTLSLSDLDCSPDFPPIKLQHPLRPRHLKCKHLIRGFVPIDWSRLVFFEAKLAITNDILDVIRNAQNLRHCIIGDGFTPDRFPTPTSPVTNNSLIYLKTFGDIAGNIIGLLILPSLKHLDYGISEGHDLCFDSIVGFLNRSHPPLANLIIRCTLSAYDSFPSFQKLPGITSLLIDGIGRAQNTAEIDDLLLSLTIPSTKVILPRLKELKLIEFEITRRLLPAHVFCFDPQANTANLKHTSENTASFQRPLSRVDIRVSHRNCQWLKTNKTIFLHLLALKALGVEVFVQDYRDKDFFASLAKLHGVVL